MITNKDIRVENGSLIINGDPYPLDGQSPETIMGIVEDNSDTTPTENSTAPVTSGGVYTALEKVWKLDAGTLIPDNSDLNTYKTPGNYYHLSANVSTITNIPENKGFRLTVLIDLYDPAFVEQLFNPIGSFKTYKRYYSTANTWSDWKVVEDDLSTKQDTLTFDTTPTAENTNPVTSAGIKTYVDTLVSNKAIVIKATSSDTKNFSIPLSVWTDAGYTGSNHTALFCGGYNGRISAGLVGTNGSAVTAIKLGDNTVSAAIADNTITLTFSDTVSTDLRLILFN